MVRRSYVRAVGGARKEKEVIERIVTPEGVLYKVNGEEVLLERDTPKGKNIVVVGNPRAKKIEQAARRYYEGMITPVMQEIMKAPPEKKLKLLEQARREMKKFNPDLLFIEKEEGGIEPLGDPVLEKKTQLGLNRGIKDVKEEFFEWLEKQEEKARRELQKQKKKKRPSKSKKGPRQVKKPKSRTKQVVRELAPQESFEERLRQKLEEEKRQKMSREFADYIAKNSIMRDEIARAFDLKNSKPSTVARFLQSEEFQGKILRRY